jgi:hypothetical protein
MKKFVDKKECKREGRLEYENGSVTINFDTYELLLHYGSSDKECRMTLQPEYAAPDRKYAVQLDMVERCFNENIPPFLIDGVDLQIESLEWLFKQRKEIQ